MLKGKLNNLFANIGEKMKITALICFCIYFLAALAGCIYLCFFDDWVFLLIPVFILASFFVAWLLAMPLYAFGELIEKTSSIENHLTKNQSEYIVKDNSIKKVNISNIEKIDKLLADGLITEEEYKNIINLEKGE